MKLQVPREEEKALRADMQLLLMPSAGLGT